MDIKQMLKEIGEKSAVKSVALGCWPRQIYQPKPPAKIQNLVNKAK